MKRHFCFGLVSVAAFLVAASSSGFAQAGDMMAHGSEMTAIKQAVAVLHPTKGNNAEGVITVTKEGDKIRVKGEVRGLSPGKHGFHVHEFGDCSSPDASSAGGHFNPTGMPHAAPDAPKRHVGDLGNIEASADGVATIDVLDELLSFDGNTSIIGRGLIVHAKADDLKSQPAGEAGPRVACGVIGVGKSK